MIGQSSPAVTCESEGSIESDATVTARIVSAVAEREGVDPVDLDAPLYEAVDPDALASLVNSGPETQLTIGFDYAGYRVTVAADEELVVDVMPLA
jgi:hypothetical protein